MLIAGDVVKVTRPIDRFPYCVIRPGAVGTITEVTDELVRLRLHEPTPELSEWDNHLEFYPSNNPEHNFELFFCLQIFGFSRSA